MAQVTINVGTAANDGTGDPLRTAFQTTNSNFTQLFSPTVTDKGTIASGTVTFNYATGGPVQKLTVGGALTVAYAGWPATGIYADIEVQLVNGGAFVVTWPTVNWFIGDGTSSTTFANMLVTLQAAGTNFVLVWTTDGGTTLYGRAI